MAEPTLEQLREAAAACTDCDLYEHATQTVFGEGPTTADLMLAGEQPGDREDLQGHPFVGPAGRVLARALDEAGIDPSQAYVTNVVKHFKFTQRGRRGFRVTQQCGEVFGWPDGDPQRRIMGTVHPSAILRMDDADRESGMAHFVADLRVAARLLANGSQPPCPADPQHPGAVGC